MLPDNDGDGDGDDGIGSGNRENKEILCLYLKGVDGGVVLLSRK